MPLGRFQVTKDDSWKDRPDLESIRGDVMVQLEWIGEGLNGDYSSNDPQDEPRMRFTVCERVSKNEWVDIENASYCTRLDPRLPQDVLQKACDRILADVYEDVAAGNTIKKKCEQLSWIDSSWVDSWVDGQKRSFTAKLTIGSITIDTKTGEVTIPEGMELSEASRQIWEGIKDVCLLKPIM